MWFYRYSYYWESICLKSKVIKIKVTLTYIILKRYSYYGKNIIIISTYYEW